MGLFMFDFKFKGLVQIGHFFQMLGSVHMSSSVRMSGSVWMLNFVFDTLDINTLWYFWHCKTFFTLLTFFDTFDIFDPFFTPLDIFNTFHIIWHILILFYTSDIRLYILYISDTFDILWHASWQFWHFLTLMDTCWHFDIN